ncbi:MAG: 5-formyltetrahydrofolate cyclo-ligase [Scytonema sp. RU_4_4]|nr:5-formyltetrahydrofolate cyclo-ligase [Scytonema sp. RU_4_4]NJR73587.1 5-formyltetrahydrofolate cyclo-ligase [Scytonema sp. CRU_2_7]
MGKAELRKSLLKTRQSLSATDWKQKSHLICQNLLTSPQFHRAKTILAYFSFRQEPDLSLLFTDTSHRWGFPRCVGKSLSWHLWTHQDVVITGAYGISEPHSDSPIIAPAEVDLILVPCVACDEQGYRLGYGGGYYDRMLSSPEWTNKPTIGIVFEFAYLPELPIDTWDKPLQGVCTEKALVYQ